MFGSLIAKCGVFAIIIIGLGFNFCCFLKTTKFKCFAAIQFTRASLNLQSVQCSVLLAMQLMQTAMSAFLFISVSLTTLVRMKHRV